MKSALVTGHLGFIGQHLVARLETLGVKVQGRDRKAQRDIRDCSLPNVDICFHLAAQTDARCQMPITDATINIIGTLRLLERYQEDLVFASSSAVNYPVTPYAISKAAGEHYCKFYNARVVRLCNIHGDGGHGVIDRFREQETLEIAGDGSQTRTYAPVEKAVAALIEAAEGRGGSLTILPGRDMSVNDVANRYFREKPRRYVPRLDTDIEDGRQLCR